MTTQDLNMMVVSCSGASNTACYADRVAPEGKPYAERYNIKLIPTQVFLDDNGKEYFRQEGLFPEEELIEVMKQKGVK